ncbi:MAG: alpha/beta fold hydrolase [Bacteroidota bacterium]|nr:alpha/beta fold hydrolase [Bacteroidota bacterium]MDP4193026.1 alpha/beta fold hydrolase [Bacteroidota bacterium]MDP4196878.1 alpha/beta fold hydrolase [Bacteroidota bacterium]
MEQINTNANTWLTYMKMNPRSNKRLFCFPYAGGSSIVFRKWPENLPENIELAAIELPGRGRRLHEPLIKEIHPLVDKLTEDVYTQLKKPFYLFGHSMGALIAFEFACALKEKYDLEPEHLYVSAHAAPQICRKENPLHNLPRIEFIERLKELNGIPKEVLANEELMDLVIPILRADFTICETYRYEHQVVLSCPISVFGGLYDSSVKKADLEPWADLTSSSFDLNLLPGDHFFISKCENLLLSLLTEKLNYGTGRALYGNRFRTN